MDTRPLQTHYRANTDKRLTEKEQRATYRTGAVNEYTGEVLRKCYTKVVKKNQTLL